MENSKSVDEPDGLQTEELDRILDGQQPITRHDLQRRATLQGWIFGLIAGFVTSLLGSIAYNALKKREFLVGLMGTSSASPGSKSI
jgi:hypothetical protein